MKKTLLTSTLLMTFASASAFAHHPSADVNPNYDSVDENISDMHNTVIDARIEETEDDDMGRGDMGAMASEDRRVMPGAAFEIDPEDAVDTIGLYGDVTGALSE